MKKLLIILVALTLAGCVNHAVQQSAQGMAEGDTIKKSETPTQDDRPQ